MRCCALGPSNVSPAHSHCDALASVTSVSVVQSCGATSLRQAAFVTSLKPKAAGKRAICWMVSSTSTRPIRRPSFSRFRRIEMLKAPLSSSRKAARSMSVCCSFSFWPKGVRPTSKMVDTSTRPLALAMRLACSASSLPRALASLISESLLCAGNWRYSSTMSLTPTMIATMSLGPKRSLDRCWSILSRTSATLAPSVAYMMPWGSATKSVLHCG